MMMLGLDLKLPLNLFRGDSPSNSESNNVPEFVDEPSFVEEASNECR